jgi:hypothetical protein
MRATLETLIAEQQDVVVVATGATARQPVLQGMESNQVV